MSKLRTASSVAGASVPEPERAAAEGRAPRASSSAGSRTAAADAPATTLLVLGCLHGAMLVPLWTAMWLGWLPVPTWATPIAWHAHEMTSGLILASTSAAMWSLGAARASGAPMLRWAIVGVWVLGRIAFVTAPAASPIWLAAIDLPLLPALALTLVRGAGGADGPPRRGVAALLVGWALANAMLHAGALGFAPGLARETAHLPVHLAAALLVILGPRWLVSEPISESREIVLLSVATLVAALVLDALGVVTGDETEEHAAALRLLAAVLLVVRIHRWRTAGPPSGAASTALLAAYAWLPLGLVLEAASEVFAAWPEAAGLHALTIGGLAGSAIAAALALPRATRPSTRRESAPALLRWSALSLAPQLTMSAAAVLRVVGELAGPIAVPALASAAGLFSLSLLGAAAIAASARRGV